jgi:hypothetical protein
MLMLIDEFDARVILEMENVCYSEGMGPNDDLGLLLRIFQAFPHLKDEYPSTAEYIIK